MGDLRSKSSERGTANVEHATLVVLMALTACAVGAMLMGGGPNENRSLASTLAFKQRCAVRYPDPCWRDPLTEAYGSGLDGAVRALAPAPEAKVGPGGVGLVGVDYRRCRQPSCATPLPGPEGLHLTVSNRRTTAFTSVRDAPARGGGIGIVYWIFRPSIGWEVIRREVHPGELDRYAGTPLLDSDDPVLVPLETLLGRDDARFIAGEEPPWRGKVESRWGG